jgi:hypothetical protein
VNPQIVRDGVRWLIAKPIPTLLAGVVLALALGIGTVAFSVLNAAILRPAPYKKPCASCKERAAGTVRSCPISAYPTFKGSTHSPNRAAKGLGAIWWSL